MTKWLATSLVVAVALTAPAAASRSTSSQADSICASEKTAST